MAIPVGACAAPGNAQPATATVLRVVDGDTVDVVDDARGRLRVRVLDTPETKKPGYIACWGSQATDFAATTLLSQRVALVASDSTTFRSRFGIEMSWDAGWLILTRRV